MKVGRVIARPVVGDAQSEFTRTTNRPRIFAIKAACAGGSATWMQDGCARVCAWARSVDIFSMAGFDEVRP